jgi:hypothetical protein
VLHDGAQLYINIKDALLGVQKEKEEEEEDIFILFFSFLSIPSPFSPRLLHTHRQTHFKYLTVPQPERKKERKKRSLNPPTPFWERGGRTTRVRFMRSQMKKTRQTFSLVRFPSPMN